VSVLCCIGVPSTCANLTVCRRCGYRGWPACVIGDQPELIMSPGSGSVGALSAKGGSAFPRTDAVSIMSQKGAWIPPDSIPPFLPFHSHPFPAPPTGQPFSTFHMHDQIPLSHSPQRPSSLCCFDPLLALLAVPVPISHARRALYGIKYILLIEISPFFECLKLLKQTSSSSRTTRVPCSKEVDVCSKMSASSSSLQEPQKVQSQVNGP